MGETIHINHMDPREAGRITGKRKCCRCQGYVDPDDLWVLTNLRGEWILVPAADVSKKALCRDCADEGLSQKGH